MKQWKVRVYMPGTSTGFDTVVSAPDYGTATRVAKAQYPTATYISNPTEVK